MSWLDKIIAAIIALFAAKPPKPPAAGGSTATGDEVFVDAWDDRNVSRWPITAAITGARITSDGVRVAAITGTSHWPVRADGGVKPTVGNWWLAAKCSDGKVHAATIEWYGRGSLAVVGKKWDGADDIHGVLGTYRPKKGDVVGVFVSGCARGADLTILERSAIVRCVWP
jgi:hypothetical protein